ncbi:MAG: GGDEF domain-containing protein [Blautia sp.]|nr:GGDEF domain-containing protein [Blautia sp.]
MKKVLYILNDCMRKYSYERISGLVTNLQALPGGGSLYIIRSDAYSGFSTEHNQGEYNIYRLPDFSDFDAIILDINRIFSGGPESLGAENIQYVFEAAAASGKPVISMANHLQGLHYVGIDNYEAMTAVIRHLHQDLGKTDFWFALGPNDNYENQERTRALRDYCRIHGLPCTDDRFYSESFIVECGIHAFTRLRTSHGGALPQAVICANDHIALGVCHAAKVSGYQIPRDFLVTGFDNADLASSIYPALTTVDQQAWNMGRTCVDLLRRIWADEPVPEVVTTRTRLLQRESTGDHVDPSDMPHLNTDEYIGSSASITDFNYKLSILQYRFPTCTSIEEICEAFMECISVLNCKGVDLVLDSRLFDPELSIGFKEQIGRLHDPAEGMPVRGYADTLELVFSWRAGRPASFPYRRVGRSLTALRPDSSDSHHLFAPLHFMEHTAGYLCLHDCMDLIRIKGVSTVVSTLTMALRTYFTGRDLAYVNHVLAGISMKDGLTGLYNRLGYHEYAYSLFRKVNAAGERLAIIFIDMDHLKWINDRYGHAAGDLAIKCIAEAILENIPGNAIPVRYGGDEFLILCPVSEEGEAREILRSICRSLPGTGDKAGVPEEITFSSGLVLTDPRSEKLLDDYVQEADTIMYTKKR